MTEQNSDQLGEMLSAYLDGELGDADRVRVQQLLERDPAARRLWEDLQETVATVSSLPRHAAPDSILVTLHHQLERRELVGAFDEELDATTRAHGGRAVGRFARWATAAVVGLAAVGGLWALVDRYQPRRGANEVVVLRTPAEQVVAPDALEPNGAAPIRENVARRGRRKSAPRPATSADELESVRASERMAQPELDRPSKPTTSRFTKRRAVHKEERERLTRGAPVAPSFRTTIARKISRGADVAALRDHSFGAESVHIQIDVKTAADRDRIIRAMTENLNKRAVPGLGAYASGGTSARVGAAIGERRTDGTPPARFFLTGRAGLNYSDDSRRQLLVRSAIPDVRALLQSIRASDSTADVSLTVKGARVDGFGDADDIFAQAHVAAQSSGLVPADLALPAMNLATQAGRRQGADRTRRAGRRPSASRATDDKTVAPLSKEADVEANEGKQDRDYARTKEESAKPATTNHRAEFQFDAPTGKFSDETSLVDRRLEAAQSTKPRATNDASRPMGATYRVVTFVIDVGVRKTSKTMSSPASTRPYSRSKNRDREPPSKPTPPPK